MEKQRSKQAQKQGKGENTKTGNLEKQKARKNWKPEKQTGKETEKHRNKKSKKQRKKTKKLKNGKTTKKWKAEKQASKEKRRSKEAEKNKKNWKASKPGTRNPGKKKQHLPEQKIFLKKNVQFRSRFGDPATRSPRNESIILGCYVLFSSSGLGNPACEIYWKFAF